MKIYSLLTVQLTDKLGEYLPVESHCYDYPENLPIMRCDRGAAKQAKSNVATANSTAGNYGTQAGQVGASIIPGLEREAQNPIGFTPMQKNDMLVSGAEAVGGVNSGVRGEANLAASRTRNAGGFAPSLDEAARVKGRQLATNALNVSGEDAKLAQQKQQFAQSQLAGIRGTDITAQLKAMGLSDEAIAEELKANNQGWWQKTIQGVDAVTGAGKGAASSFAELQ